MRLRAAATALLAGLVFASVGAADARAHGPLLLGVQDDPVFVHLPYYNGKRVRHVMPAKRGYLWAKKLGADVIRIAVHWSTVVPRRGVEGWSYYDNAIAQARKQGFFVQLELTGPAPAFATPNHHGGVYRPNASAFARFAAGAASRYQGQIQAYSIWNEPNWWDQLEPMRSSAPLYRQLYEGAYAAIKRVDPKALVLIGELAPMGFARSSIPPLRFLRELTCRTRAMKPTGRCKPLLADGFALHPYTLSSQPRFPGKTRDDATTGSLSRLIHMLDQLARVGALRTPQGHALDVYLTEYGWHVQTRRMSESTRARFAREGFAIAFAHPQVKEIVWYQLTPPPPNRHVTWNTALLGANGRITRTFTALRGWIASIKRWVVPG
ncbi:MAG TPA: cellulase family glycosylhydrolase [Solirubrobacteraceae bacterium]|jgi:hypothetical protein